MSDDPRSPGHGVGSAAGGVTDAERHEPERGDGTVEADVRQVWRLLVSEPVLRAYFLTGLGSLGVVFLFHLDHASDLGGLLVVLLGTAGLILRWPAAPLWALGLITYFLLFPIGIPGAAFEKRWEIAEGFFRAGDVVLVLAILVYVGVHYRVMSVTWQAAGFEGRRQRTPTPRDRRPVALVETGELGWLLGVGLGAVVVGQCVWWVANCVEIRPGEEFPFAWVGPSRSTRRVEPPGGLPPGPTRFLLLAGLLFFGWVLARLVFGYWRLRVMGPAQGAMLLLNEGWVETKRERSRIEAWRSWGRRRATPRDVAERRELAEPMPAVTPPRRTRGAGR